MSPALALLVLFAAQGALNAVAPAQESAPATLPASRAEAPSIGAARAEAAGKHQEAAALFAAAVAESPLDAAAWHGLVRTLAAAGALNDALDRGEEAIKALPRDPEALALLARVLSLKGEQMRRSSAPGAEAQFHFEDAVRHAGKALELDASHRDARLILAQSLFQLGRLDDAAKEALAATERFPAHPGGPLLSGEIAFERFLAAHAETAAGAPPARRPAAEAEKEKQLTAASAHFREAIKRDPKRARAWRMLGDLLAWRGKESEMADCFRQSLSLDPENGARHDFVSERLSSEAAAKLYADAAVLHDKNFPAAKRQGALLLWYQGYHLFRGKKFKQCVAPLEEALRRNPSYLNSLFYLGRAADFDGDDAGARKHLTRYANEDPISFADLLKGLGKDGEAVTSQLVFLAAKANREGQMKDCRALSYVLALTRDTADDWNNYAFLCRETGEYEKSYEAYRRALDSSPDDPSLLNDCAVILQYHLDRDLDQARRMYERALEEGQKVLRNPKSNETTRARARQAIQDAKGNLAKLKKG